MPFAALLTTSQLRQHSRPAGSWMSRSSRMAALLLLLALSLAACAPTPGSGQAATRKAEAGADATSKPSIRIGSTNFSEQITLAELYSQMLEANGYAVERRFNLGNREVVAPALESGHIDLYVEYLASMLRYVDKNARASADAAETHEALQRALKPRNLAVLGYAPAVDTNAFGVTRSTAAQYGLSKLSDLSPVADRLVLGGPPECTQRPFCLLGLQDT
ncbi:MAG: hypothetical protein M3336_09280, partial [Chloroflexota bacterium]|nr:hypothetical protein [Chloroflexota bacterium]